MPRHPSPPNATMLIACLGNEHRGDDGFGLLVARRLGAGTRHVRVLAHGGDALSLIDAWRGVDRVVIVDAIAADLAPGRYPADRCGGSGAAPHAPASSL